MHIPPRMRGATAHTGREQDSAVGASAPEPPWKYADGRRRRLAVGAFVVAAMLAAMAPLAAFGVYAAVEAQRGKRAQTEMQMLEVSRAVANAVDTELQSRLTAAQLIASLPVFDHFPQMLPEAKYRLLERIQDFGSALDGADVGIWTIGHPAPEMVAGTVRPFEWLHAVTGVPQAVHAIRQAVREQRPLLSDSFATRISGVSNALLAVPVLRAGAAIAVVTISVPGARLQEVLARQALPSQAFVVVIDGEDRVAAREPERNIGRLSTQDFRDAVIGRSSGVFRATTLDGETAVAAFTDLRLAPGYKVAIAAPASIVEVGWTRTRDLLIAGGAAAALIASLAVMLSSRLWSSARGQMLDQDTYLSIALDKTGLATWESDRHTGKALWSPRHFDILGYPRRPSGEVSIRLWWEAVHPDDAQAVLDQWRMGQAHPEGLLRLTYRIIRRDNGETRWCESIGRFIAPGRLIGVIMDVTDARRVEEERLLLAREVDHRSKNLLAVVQAMITMTQAEDAETLRTALASRILSLAKTHTLLAQNRWTGSSVREVAENELHARGDAVRMDGPEVPLRADAMQPLAMALHELATNAAKYGALSAEGGRVAVSWRVEPPHLVMEWRERGGPVVEPPTTKGFGSRMISRVLAQLGGTVEFVWDPEGLTAEIRIPLDRIA